MDPGQLIHQCCRVAGIDAANPADPESLIGFLQQLRPSGDRIEEALVGLPRFEEVVGRLRELYTLCGDARRPAGGKDVYFIVRTPSNIGSDDVETLASHWLSQLQMLAGSLKNEKAETLLQSIKGIRVLEGLPPKHPRNREEWSSLLLGFHEILPRMMDGLLERFPVIGVLRPAYYYIACDSFLRDYFLWPLYEHALSLDWPSARPQGSLDPFRSYYLLWSHGIKYRIFTDDQIDFYIPRPRH